MNYATRRLAEVQQRLPGQPSTPAGWPGQPERAGAWPRPHQDQQIL